MRTFLFLFCIASLLTLKPLCCSLRQGFSPDNQKTVSGFFDDISIPPENFNRHFQNRFDVSAQGWVMEMGEYTNNMEAGQQIRFRVSSDLFVDIMPRVVRAEGKEDADTKIAPYSITGSIDDPGLGPTSIAWS